jgi:predicted MPP superfamily phosphohydrolase
VRWWLIALNGALLAIAVALAADGNRRAIWVAALVPVAFAPFAYARLRLHRRLAAVLRDRRLRTVLGTVEACCDLVMMAQLLSARATGTAAWLNEAAVGWIGPVWFSTHAMLFVAYAGLGAARRIRRMLRAMTPFTTDQRSAPGGEGVMGRRQFLQHASVLGVAAPFAISISGVSVSYAFRVDEHEIELPRWPAALDGLRVAHLSDIHVGGAMDAARLRRVAALTAAAEPDLIVHTGDFLTHRRGNFDAPLYEAFAQLRPPHGQWACLGNHDFDDPARLERKLAGAGVTLLRDRVVAITVRGQRLEVGGLDFLFGRRALDETYRRILQSWPERRGPRLLLNHDPRAFAALPEGCADLVLSGHTHGGHIGLQLGPEHAITLVGLAGIPDQGRFRRGDLRLFVTRCVGFYGYPMRVGIPPEIALLVLRAPKRSAV